MACNSCAKGYSLLRQEKGCPSCGFSFCSKCLNNKVFLPKLKAEAKVCTKCKRACESQENDNKVLPPDAYFKRLAAAEEKSIENPTTSSKLNAELQSIDDQIQARLKKLKESNQPKAVTEEEIAKRLQNIKGEVPSTSDTELHSRLAKLKGVPNFDASSKPALPIKDTRTEQEQADELMKQYLEQTQIDSKYQDEFDNLISDMESRMQKLKGATPVKEVLPPEGTKNCASTHIDHESEDEEESVRKIVEKIKSEASITDDEISVAVNDELPFCEICNEDAKMRCLGCRYLFCKRCFLDHKDDDDGCDSYEPYQPPKGSQY